MGKITKKQMEIVKRIFSVIGTIISTILFKNRMGK